MRLLLILLAALYIQGCASIPGQTYMEVGVGKNHSAFQSNDRFKWEDRNSPGFYGSVRQELVFTGHLGGVCHYSHYSQWLVGPPFDNRGENSLDHVGCALRWRVPN